MIKSNVELKNLNTFSVSAVASHFIEFDITKNLNQTLALIQKYSNRFVLGGGSNILFVSDFDGLIILPQIFGMNVLSESENNIIVSVGASQNWHQFVLNATEKGWYGLENLALIPGTVGAAPVQNIGAYGVEVKQFIHSVEYIDLDNGQQLKMKGDECQFEYRDSRFKQARVGKYLITKVAFNLKKSFQPCLTYPSLASFFEKYSSISAHQLLQRVCQIRQQKLPDPEELANAGSFFKNPLIDVEKYEKLKSQYPEMIGYPMNDQVKLAAGWLIEKAGFKGMRDVDVGVHINQALVLVNYAESQGIKIWQLAKKIQQKIDQMFQVRLEPEVRMIGNLPL